MTRTSSREVISTQQQKIVARVATVIYRGAANADPRSRMREFRTSGSVGALGG